MYRLPNCDYRTAWYHALKTEWWSWWWRPLRHLAWWESSIQLQTAGATPELKDAEQYLFPSVKWLPKSWRSRGIGAAWEDLPTPSTIVGKAAAMAMGCCRIRQWLIFHLLQQEWMFLALPLSTLSSKSKFHANASVQRNLNHIWNPRCQRV